MSVCNLFKALTKETGTFITFSQYVDDLAQVVGNQPTVNVVPSKFYALNIDYSSYDNESLMQEFQNGFENMISLSKNDYWESISDLNPGWDDKYDYFTSCFWAQLSNMGWMNEDNGVLENFMYEGSIELVGARQENPANVKDGMSYTEFFCHIPNSAKRQFITVFESAAIDQVSMSGKAYPEGWPLWDTSKPADAVPYVQSSYVTPEYKIQLENDGEDDDATQFEFNTIVVLYDIYVYDTVNAQYYSVHSNVPMGIYFTGRIDDNTGKMSNSVTKYVSNDSIFENGTSYGLRVCSRFVTALDNDSVQEAVIISDATEYLDYSSVMSAMARTLQKVNDLIDSVNVNNTRWLEWISQWKNKTVNVPYVQTVSGVPYWFVNGKMVIPVYAESAAPGPEPGPAIEM